MSSWRIGVEAGATGRGPRLGGVGDGGVTGDEGPFSGVMSRLTKWIPSDTLIVYLPGVTLLAGDTGRPSLIFLILMIVVTPLFVLGAAFATGKITKRVVVSAVLAAVAFAIWSLPVPLSGWQALSAVKANAGAVAVGAAIAGILFSFLAEGLVRRL